MTHLRCICNRHSKPTWKYGNREDDATIVWLCVFIETLYAFSLRFIQVLF